MSFCASLQRSAVEIASCDLSARIRGWLSSKVVERSACWSSVQQVRAAIWIRSEDNTRYRVSEPPFCNAHTLSAVASAENTVARTRKFARQLRTIAVGEHGIVAARKRSDWAR